MENISNIALSAKLASDTLMFDAEGKHIPKEVAIKAGPPEKTGLKYVAFYVKYPDYFEIHAYYISYSGEKRSASAVSILEWPEEAKKVLTDRWGIDFGEIALHENAATIDTPSFIV